MIKKTDTNLTGLILGIIGPLVMMVIMYFVRFTSQYNFVDFVEMLFKMQLFGKILSLCAIPNLVIFFLFLWTDKYRAAWGVIASTLILTFFMLIIKFL